MVNPIMSIVDVIPRPNQNAKREDTGPVFFINLQSDIYGIRQEFLDAEYRMAADEGITLFQNMSFDPDPTAAENLLNSDQVRNLVQSICKCYRFDDVLGIEKLNAAFLKFYLILEFCLDNLPRCNWRWICSIEWFELLCNCEVQASMTDHEIIKLAAEFEDQARKENILFRDSLLEYLIEIRKKLRAESSRDELLVRI